MTQGFEIVIFRIFSKKEINEKSRNFRNHDFATFPLSHFPTFREFFPPAPQPRIWAAAAWSGEKLAESRKVGKWESREIAISEISWFFMDFLIGKNAKIWDFWRILEFSEKMEKSKGGPLKSWFFAFFQIRKSMKNREISKIAISRLSHFPTFLLSASFFPRRPSRESGRRPLDSENSWRNQREGGRRDSTTENGRL